MSQHDFNIANASGPSVRADLNAALNAIVTLSSGSTPPSPSFANQFWFDTSTSYLKKRDNANTTWQALLHVDSNGNISFKPGANDRQLQFRNATDAIVATLRADTAGDGRISARDRTAVQRVMMHGLQTGGRIYLDGDESTGKQVAPLLTIGPTEMTGLSNATVSTIPAGASAIDAVFHEIMPSGGNNFLVQLGPLAGVDGAGYTSIGVGVVPSGSNSAEYVPTSGFGMRSGTSTRSHGVMHLRRLSGDTWIQTFTLQRESPAQVNLGAGIKTLADTLTSFRLDLDGSDTFLDGRFTLHVRF